MYLIDNKTMLNLNEALEEYEYLLNRAQYYKDPVKFEPLSALSLKFRAISEKLNEAEETND